VNDDDTSTTTSFELMIIFLSQPVCIVISLFLLIIDVRMTTAALKKNINARSLTMRVRIFQPQVSVAVLRMGYVEVVFIQPGGKLDTM